MSSNRKSPEAREINRERREQDRLRSAARSTARLAKTLARPTFDLGTTLVASAGMTVDGLQALARLEEAYA